MDPSAFFESAWCMIWDVEYLLTRCFDPQGMGILKELWVLTMDILLKKYNSHNFHGIYWELMNYTQYLIQATGNGNGSFQWIMLVDIVMEF